MRDDKTMSAKGKPDAENDSTEMAVMRTAMAADRSLMAWVRTGLSLISFGFTIYKFLEYTKEQIMEAGRMPGSASSPRVIGLFMIGVGILCLVLGTIENVAIIRGLRQRHEFKHSGYALFMAGILTVFGIVLFIGVILRLKGIGS